MMNDLESKLRQTVRAQNKAESTADAYWHWTSRYLGYCKRCGIGKETKAEDVVERLLS